MFAHLPETLKKEVLYHLEKNDFPKAKAIHDAWIHSHRIPLKKDAAKITHAD